MNGVNAFHRSEAPLAGDSHIPVTHDAIVRISPAAESISAGHIVIRVFHINSVTLRVLTIYRIALALDVSSIICGKGYAFRHISTPVVLYAMSADFFILIAPTAGNHNSLVTHDAIV